MMCHGVFAWVNTWFQAGAFTWARSCCESGSTLLHFEKKSTDHKQCHRSEFEWRGDEAELESSDSPFRLWNWDLHYMTAICKHQTCSKNCPCLWPKQPPNWSSVGFLLTVQSKEHSWGRPLMKFWLTIDIPFHPKGDWCGWAQRSVQTVGVPVRTLYAISSWTFACGSIGKVQLKCEIVFPKLKHINVFNKRGVWLLLVMSLYMLRGKIQLYSVFAFMMGGTVA